MDNSNTEAENETERIKRGDRVFETQSDVVHEAEHTRAWLCASDGGALRHPYYNLSVRLVSPQLVRLAIIILQLINIRVALYVLEPSVPWPIASRMNTRYV